MPWDTRDGDAGAAQGSAPTAAPCVRLNPVKAAPASCIAGLESGTMGERVWKRLFGVQVPLPEAWDGPSTREMPIWMSPASAQPDTPAPSW